MPDEPMLNRLEFMLLDTLYDEKCITPYVSMTITEIMTQNGGDAFGNRQTIYRKMRKLVKQRYIGKGCVDNHADTYYLLEKGIRFIEEGRGK